MENSANDAFGIAATTTTTHMFDWIIRYLEIIVKYILDIFFYNIWFYHQYFPEIRPLLCNKAVNLEPKGKMIPHVSDFLQFVHINGLMIA